MENQSEQIETN